MSLYITGQSSRQVTFLPPCLDDLIGQDNPVRFIDAFVDSLNLRALGLCGKDRVCVDGTTIKAVNGMDAATSM